MYKLMDNYGYDFYENDVLNGIFSTIVSVAAKGVKADRVLPVDSNKVSGKGMMCLNLYVLRITNY